MMFLIWGCILLPVTFCFGNPGENKTQGEQNSPGSGLAVPYSSWCACLALKPAPHQAKNWALAGALQCEDPPSRLWGFIDRLTPSAEGLQGIWMCCSLSLAGCTLFFYETDGRSGIDHNSIPKHAVWVENSIVQAVPEHPKKDFVFCLSNSLGDAFLFQVGFCKVFFCLPARRTFLALVEICGKSC